MSLCDKKNIFGEPNTGVHRYRVFGLAAVDLGLTFALAVLIGRGRVKDVMVSFAVLMIIGLAMHKLFCVETALVKATQKKITSVLM